MEAGESQEAARQNVQGKIHVGAGAHRFVCGLRPGQEPMESGPYLANNKCPLCGHLLTE